MAYILQGAHLWSVSPVTNSFLIPHSSLPQAGGGDGDGLGVGDFFMEELDECGGAGFGVADDGLKGMELFAGARL